MPTVWGVDHKVFAAGTIAASVGIAIYTTYRLSRGCGKSGTAPSEYYETQKLVDEYLLFHYGKSKEVLLQDFEDFAPTDSLEFPRRCAELCLKYYKPQTGIPNRALDIGCAVGRSTFELAKVVDEAVGIDYSHAFVNCCNELKQKGSMMYTMTSEGDLRSEFKAVVPVGIEVRKKTKFAQGDACNLPENLGQFGVVLAANLVCRLHSPEKFLDHLSTLVAPGGILVITAPYTWMPQFCEKSKWLGGFKDQQGHPVFGFDGLKKMLGSAFNLLDDRNLPFLIRETARKHQWTVAHASVWQKK